MGRARIQKRAMRTLARQGGKKYLQTVVRERCKDFTPIWDAVEQYMFFNERLVFEREGAIEVGEWSAGKGAKWPTTGGRNYRRWKDKWYPMRKTLDLTGRLRRQMVGQSGDHWVWKQKRMFQFGSNLAAKDGSGIRSFVNTRGVLPTPQQTHWSMEAPNDDIGGAHAIGGKWLDGIGRNGKEEYGLRGVRDIIIIDRDVEDTIISEIIDHATDTVDADFLA